MTSETILVIDDESEMLELIKYNVEKEGFKTILAKSGGEAIDIAFKREVDLVVLDIMLPGIDGFEVCKLLKTNSDTQRIPVIIVTAKGEEQDIVKGLELGADDYIIKPFSPKVLIARIKALLRRFNFKSRISNLIKLGAIQINLPKHEVTINDELLQLTALEFKLLVLLSKNPGQVFTRNQILENIWNEETFVTERTVDVHIRGLRKKLGLFSECIESIRGIGYKFQEIKENE